MNTIKALLIALALIASVPASADNTTWELSNDNSQVFMSDSVENAVAMAGEHMLVGSISNCTTATGLTIPIHGQMVKVNRMQMEDVCWIAPVSSAGQAYLVGLFKSRSSVTVNGTKYSAKGFTKAYNAIGTHVNVL